ncbi:VOC family protein [Pendulispora brunnea]|uniref:VOC family protein n=1 Tax=Pendulispora brunnea TaxID=2905690 RepID=A0ABZ2JU99_9BACT
MSTKGTETTEATGTRATKAEGTHDDVPKIFRVTLEVANIDEAARFYTELLGQEGKRHQGSRHYYDCGGVILALLDVSAGGLPPTPGPKSLYMAVRDLEAVHARATALNALAPYKVHGQPAGDPVQRPWGERSFYVVDPWGNDLCFVKEGTLYT